jgi:biotin carboxyl carrier protein
VKTSILSLLQFAALVWPAVFLASAPQASAQTATQSEKPLAPIRISPEQQRQAGVVTTRLQPGDAPGQSGGGMSLQGTAVLPNQAIEVVSAPLAGVVQAVLVNPMQAVRAGQQVARIHSPQLLEWQREYVQLQAQAGLARNKLKRDELLFQDGLVSESRLQDTRNAEIIAGVAARERRQTLAIAGVGTAALAGLAAGAQLSPELSVSAKRAGTITEQLAVPGQRVEMGAVLLKIVDPRVIWVELQATRAQAGAVRVGDAVRIVGCDKPARITGIGVTLSAAAQTVGLRATVPDAATCLKPNQYVEATIATVATSGTAAATTAAATAAATGAANLHAVPVQALLASQGRDYILVRSPAGFQPVAVTVVSRDATHAQVRAVLAKDAELAVQGMAILKGAWLGMGVSEADAAAPNAAAAKAR